jgi:hypothetical protein
VQNYIRLGPSLPGRRQPEKADQSDNDGRDADGDVYCGCRRVRTHDNPENSTAYYSERNEMSQYRVTHGVASMPVGSLQKPKNRGGYFVELYEYIPDAEACNFVHGLF